jgi:DNA polymerase III subunit delta
MTTRTAPTFYVLHGDDEFSRKAEVRTMRSRMGDQSTAELNTVFHDGRSTSVAEVVAAAQQMPFLSDKRLVIVDGMLMWLTRKGGGKTAKAEMEKLVAELPRLPDSARLVFVESETLDANHPVLKLVNQEPRGYAKAFNPPRDPTRWIIKQVEHHGGAIEPQAAAALAALVGMDLGAADNECIKLLTYVGTNRPITEADVSLLTQHVPDVVIWDMVDALAARNGKTALLLIHRMLKDKSNEPLGLMAMINRQFRLLLQAKEMLQAGGNVYDIPDVRSSFVVQKLTQQARNFTSEELENIYRHLLEVDHGLKSGKYAKPELALDLLVASLAA